MSSDQTHPLLSPDDASSPSHDDYHHTASHPRHDLLSAVPSFRRPSSLLHQYGQDGLLDPARSVVVTPDSSTTDGSPLPSPSTGTEGATTSGISSAGDEGRRFGSGNLFNETSSPFGASSSSPTRTAYAVEDGPGLPGYGRRGTVSKKPKHLRIPLLSSSNGGGISSWWSSTPRRYDDHDEEDEHGGADEALGIKGVGYLKNNRMEGGVIGNNSRTSRKVRQEIHGVTQGMNGNGASGGGGVYRDDDQSESLSVVIERPSTPRISTFGATSSSSRPRPGSDSFYPSSSDRNSSITLGSSTSLFRRAWNLPVRTKAKLELFCLQFGSFVVSSIFLGGVVLYALSSTFIFKTIPSYFIRGPAPSSFEWDDPVKWAKEQIVKDPNYYAEGAGVRLQEYTVESEDGFYLKLQRVVVKNPEIHSDGREGFPVLIMHGLFQSSGSFITSEERSLAFWLAKQGYQVFLGNTRGVFDMGHRVFKRSDPRFWDWTIRELAMYDLPALVKETCRLSGYEKTAFIGHSQGNGSAFISLSLGIRPDLGNSLSVFIALAPAVFAGPLTTGFPFTHLGKMEWKEWRKLFGVLDFIPVMTWAYDYAPQALFASLGYTMFAFLFAWTDTNWLQRRKAKMFRFTPSPVSSASIFWWAGKGGFASRKCLFDVKLDRWFDERFPPLSIYYGGRDFLVLTEPLLERLEIKEKDVNLIRVKKLDLSEHCDFFWAAEAVEWCYSDIVEDIESTRPRYPEELQAQQDETSNGIASKLNGSDTMTNNHVQNGHHEVLNGADGMGTDQAWSDQHGGEGDLLGTF